MSHTSVVIVGAGQAGLAVSYLLTADSVEHVVLERGRIAQRWTDERWDSMRLLTPNWMTRLPGWSYHGTDPGGFMSAREVAEFLQGYSSAFNAPVLTGANVDSVRRSAGRYLIETSRGAWTADAVVIASGFCDQPAVPGGAGDLDPRIAQITPDRYRTPADLPAGGVLVVGASATGVQLADELARDGRQVVLATGRHTRVPRSYRGLDIMWWLDAMGLLDRPVDQNRRRPRGEPSLQLIGSPDGREVDLPTLASHGVRFTGRFRGVDGSGSSRVLFADDLEASSSQSETRLTTLLKRIDDYIVAVGLDGEVDAPIPVQPFAASSVLACRQRLDLWSAGIRSVIWATGYRREYPWLNVPVLDAAGEIRHTAGITPAPGLAVIGQQWQTRRNSSFLDGVRHDAAIVVDQLVRGTLVESDRRAS